MIAVALASLMFASMAQAPPTDSQPTAAEIYQDEQEAEAYPDEQEPNGFEDADDQAREPVDTARDSEEPVAPMPAEVEDEAADEAEEEEEARVCRRVHYVDDFGRHRSSKSCTPR